MKAYLGKNKQYVKIDKHDTWSMDVTLAHIVVPMLKQLRATTHGSPLIEYEERPDHLIGTALPDPSSGDVDEFHHEAWYWILDEMIFAFESKLNDWEDAFMSGESDIGWEPAENDCYRVVYGPNHTFKIDWESRQKYQERISNGFRLFGKYYENLWD